MPGEALVPGLGVAPALFRAADAPERLGRLGRRLRGPAAEVVELCRLAPDPDLRSPAWSATSTSPSSPAAATCSRRWCSSPGPRGWPSRRWRLIPGCCAARPARPGRGGSAPRRPCGPSSRAPPGGSTPRTWRGCTASCAASQGRAIARHGFPAFRAGEPVGVVTSGSFAPTLEANIGLVYLPAGMWEPGTRFEIEIRGRREPATVAPTPFYRRPR